MIMHRITLWIGKLVLALLFTGCNVDNNGTWLKISGYTQGTTYNITYQDPDSTNYKNRIEQLLREFDMSLSTYVPTSIISRMNQGIPDVIADDYFRNCFFTAEEVYAATGGAFDITVAPVVITSSTRSRRRPAIHSGIRGAKAPFTFFRRRDMLSPVCVSVSLCLSKHLLMNGLQSAFARCLPSTSDWLNALLRCLAPCRGTQVTASKSIPSYHVCTQAISSLARSEATCVALSYLRDLTA